MSKCLSFKAYCITELGMTEKEYPVITCAEDSRRLLKELWNENKDEYIAHATSEGNGYEDYSHLWPEC